MPDIKVSDSFKDYYEVLNKRLQYLHKLLLDFKSEGLAMKIKIRHFSNITSREVMTKYVGPVVIYKIIDHHNYSLMTLDGKILRGLFENERLKTANRRINQGNVQNLAQLKQVMDVGFKI